MIKEKNIIIMVDGNLQGGYLIGRKWNGKGYYKGNISFEIKDGKGNVKEYDDKGKLIFNGE